MTKKRSKIDVKMFNPRMMMQMENTLNTYQYIQKNYKSCKTNSDFRAEYSAFYDLNANVKMVKSKTVYFDMMDALLTSPKSLIDIVKDLYSKMGKSQYEFSFATKMLHTVCDSYPIFDSKIREYLHFIEKIPFENWDKSNKKILRGLKSSTQVIKENWDKLNGWYGKCLCDPFWISVQKWFDYSFPKFVAINPVKKIDTVIFIWVKYMF